MTELKVSLLLKTFILLLIFNITFTAGAHVSYYLEDNYLIDPNKSKKNVPKLTSFIKVPSIRIIIIVIIQFIVLIAFIFYLKSELGFINSKTLNIFRGGSFYHNNQIQNFSVPGWIHILSNFSECATLISIYILINNHFTNIKRYSSKYLLMLSAIMYIPISLLNSSRYTIVIIIIYSCFLYIFLTKYLKRNTWKAMIYILIVLLIFGSLFSIIGTLIGRESSGSNSLLFYGGGCIALFNDYIKYPVSDGLSSFGIHSFNAIYKNLFKLHLINQYISTTIVNFRSINGTQIGNVYTALYPYFIDFGTLGVAVIPAIWGMVFGYLYRKLKAVKLHGISMRLLIYTFIVWTLVLPPYGETWDNSCLSFGFVFQLIMLWGLKKYYTF